MVKALRGVSFYTVVKQAAQKWVSAPQSVAAVAIKMVDAPTFTIPVSMCIKQDVENNSLQKAKIKEQFNKLAEVAQVKNVKKKDRILTKKMDLEWLSGPLTDIYDNKNANLKAYIT